MVPSPKSKGGMRASSWVGFHTFRHTCATSLIVDEDWRLEQVQVYLGHKDIATTRRYYVHPVRRRPPRAEERPRSGADAIRSRRGGVNRVQTRPSEIDRDARAYGDSETT